MRYQNEDKKYHFAPHLVYSCQYHVIFCPKYRREVLVSPLDEALKEMFIECAELHGFRVTDAEVMSDHVHLIIDCDPKYGVLRYVKDPKYYTAKHMREQFPKLKSKLPCMWTRSAFVSYVGSFSLDIVKKYLMEQKIQ